MTTVADGNKWYFEELYIQKNVPRCSIYMCKTLNGQFILKF